MARARRLRWLLVVALLLALVVARWLWPEPPEPRASDLAGAPAHEPAAPPAPERARDVRSPEAPAPPTRREAVRARLERDLAEHFPDRKLSSDELDAAADALMRLRAARLELKALPRTAENAERMRELEQEMGRAFEDFEYQVDVDPVTFTEKADEETE